MKTRIGPTKFMPGDVVKTPFGILGTVRFIINVSGRHYAVEFEKEDIKNMHFPLHSCSYDKEHKIDSGFGYFFGEEMLTIYKKMVEDTFWEDGV